ncbi:venom carboxylesterase-6-like [Trichogramma pretiosum]|uniref:venom carboxylesterase-6-like n=1 Tax=Trichogramma pretiosum TaxID=7493 RepID=UPI0006C9707F|nr:venom carboxylesterase-6-like [Trichogramma pretiosum]
MFRSASAVVAVLIFIFLSVRADSDNAPIVETPLGSVKGYRKISQNGRSYSAFEGLPYALPPIGKLRFEPPQSVKKWPGILLATSKSHPCLQYNHIPARMEDSPIAGSEDCLYLNVYVPQVERAGPLPVVVYIHGGAFQMGSGNLYGAKYIMDKNVIFVTLNYRLGPLGFLSTEDGVVPGNMGLKDQSMALRWVHDNIKHFGGDPKKVTIIGQSAGGASVHYHYLSPLSSGLFHAGISISGTALLCWAQAEAAQEKARKLSDLMGCPTGDNAKMIDCLKSRPGNAIVQAVKEFMPWLYNPYTPFGPVVEKVGNKPFINQPPVELLASGHVQDVPWITSVTSEEGLYPVADFAASEQLLQELDEKWEKLAPHLLDFNYTISPDIHGQISQKIRRHYLGNNPINRDNVGSITQMVGDRLFVVDGEKAARMQARVNKSPVHFYYYTYRASASLSDLFTGTTEDLGVSHADDAFLFVENPFMKPTTEDDLAMKDDLLHVLESYASNGSSGLVSHWNPVRPSDEDFHFLHIKGPSNFDMDSKKNFGEKLFWKSIHFEENALDSAKNRDEL